MLLIIMIMMMILMMSNGETGIELIHPHLFIVGLVFIEFVFKLLRNSLFWIESQVVSIFDTDSNQIFEGPLTRQYKTGSICKCSTEFVSKTLSFTKSIITTTRHHHQ